MIRNIPNLLTLFNLLSGCLSILFLFSGEVMLASWMIGLAAVFDFFDGFLARMLKASSSVGKVLDSLADMVSFGVAPGMIMYMMIQVHAAGYELLAYLALLVPALSAVRLAIFSVDDRQSDHFIGVPTPLNALMLASVPLILQQFGEDTFVNNLFSNTWFLFILTLVSSLLLIAPVRIIAMKFKTYGFRENGAKYILVALAAILLAVTGYLAVPLIYAVYILFSLAGLDKSGA